MMQSMLMPTNLSRWARRTRSCVRESSVWRRTLASGCFKDLSDRVTAETLPLTLICRCSRNTQTLNILYMIIIWYPSYSGLGDGDLRHWHGKDQQWRRPGTWFGRREVDGHCQSWWWWWWNHGGCLCQLILAQQFAHNASDVKMERSNLCKNSLSLLTFITNLLVKETSLQSS